jgi:hypothetical protein
MLGAGALIPEVGIFGSCHRCGLLTLHVVSFLLDLSIAMSVIRQNVSQSNLTPFQVGEQTPFPPSIPFPLSLLTFPTCLLLSHPDPHPSIPLFPHLFHLICSVFLPPSLLSRLSISLDPRFFSFLSFTFPFVWGFGTCCQESC